MMPNSVQRSLTKTIDWELVFGYLFLILIGWVNIYSAVQPSEPLSIFDLSCNAGRQFMWMMISLGVAVMILFVITPKLWESISLPAYLGVLVLLVLVIFISKNVKGSHSWFEFGPIKFQPAEISKITTSLLLSAYMSRVGFKMSNPRDFAGVALIIGLPMLAILAESETGSMLVYVGFIFVLYREGLTGWIFAYVGLTVLLFILTLRVGPMISLITLAAVCVLFLFYALQMSLRSRRQRRKNLWLTLATFVAGSGFIYLVPFVFNNVLKDHQRARIMVLLGMKEDLKGVGYNVHQSMIAIGSGGVFGKGYLRGTQTGFGFVPEQSTDFIFCTIGEEWGFAGCLFLISLYTYVIFRIVNDAEQCRESFTRIYGYCLASCLFMHMFINIGMTIGLVPVIGIPLPLLSYGGSSLLAFTVMIFIFLALYRQDKKYY